MLRGLCPHFLIAVAALLETAVSPQDFGRYRADPSSDDEAKTISEEAEENTEKS
jgi:hypothetical protein